MPEPTRFLMLFFIIFEGCDSEALGELDVHALVHADFALLEERGQRLHHVADQVELRVVHRDRRYQRRWSPAFVIEFLRMSVADDLVLFAMDEEGGAGHSGNEVDVAEAVAHECAEHASLLSGDVADRLEGRHQQKRARPVPRRQRDRRTRADAASKQD